MDLVIGGSGFIGAHLVSMLLDSGRSVRVLDLASFPWESGASPTEFIVGDILDAQTVAEAVKGCEVVYHLAANPNLWHRRPTVFDKVNRQGTQNVVEACRAARSAKLVYTSTESILSPRDHVGPIDENVETTLDDMIGPYCRSKFQAEQAVMDFAAEGFPAIVVNPTMPVGPGDRNLTPPGRMIRDFLQGKMKGYMECTLNFVDVRDAALGHILAAEHGEPGRRHILAGHNLQVKEFFEKLAALTGRTAPTMKVPYGTALAFSVLEEWFGKLTGRRPMSSSTGVRLCRRSMEFDGSTTWKRLGDHQPRPLDETLRDAVAWHRDEMGKDGRRA